MATANQILDMEASQIGYKGNYNKYNKWYWQDLNGYSYDPGSAWCAAFQSWSAMMVNLICAYSASAAAFATQFPKVADKDVQPGDMVLFNWDGRTDTNWADHVGIVEWSDINGSGYFGTIEGNTGNSEVARMTRNNNAGYFTAFYRPNYDSITPNPGKPSKKGTKVQRVYNSGGMYHRFYKPKTKKAAAEHRYARTQSTFDSYKKSGYTDEGVVWVAPKNGTIPVYKMYNASNGDILLTTSYKEAQEAENIGYEYRGVPFFAKKDGVKVYRYYNTNTGEHLFGTSKNELTRLKKTAGWKYEGIAFYVDTAGTAGDK